MYVHSRSHDKRGSFSIDLPIPGHITNGTITSFFVVDGLVRHGGLSKRRKRKKFERRSIPTKFADSAD